MNMKTRKVIAMMASVMMFGSVAAACGDSNNENKTPHTTYSADQINNMSDDELEKALENAAKEIEASGKAETEAPAEENEGIDFWKDVKVTFYGAEGFIKVTAEYVGDNQIIKDNVVLSTSVTGEQGINPFCGEVNVYNGENYLIAAWYDEEALKEQEVILKKVKYEEPQKGHKFLSVDPTDYCYFTVSGLGTKVEITDDTDTSVFVDALDAVTEKVKEKADEDTYGFDWAKDSEYYPDEFYMVKGTTGTGWIRYVDQEGNVLAWIMASQLNYVDGDGKWIRDAWIGNPYYRISSDSILGCVKESLVKVNID